MAEVLGFLSVNQSDQGLRMFQTYHAGLTYLALFQFPLDANGNITGRPDPKLIEQAHDYGVGILLVLSNFSGSQFNPFIMHNILVQANVQTNLLSNLVALLVTYNLDGVNLDLENMFAADRNLFSVFVAKLAKVLRQLGKLVTVSVPAKLQDDLQAAWRGAFDYAALGNVVDRVVLMTYEEHWAASEPGPVASTPWVNGVLAYATALIDPSKLLLGLPLYGYDWPLGQARGNTVTHTQALGLANRTGATINWDTVMQSPYFNYRDAQGRQHEVWFENVQSVQTKIELGQSYHIAGFAVWAMQLSFPQFWQYIFNNLRIVSPVKR